MTNSDPATPRPPRPSLLEPKRPPRYAYVTLVTTDAYLAGAITLAHSLRSLLPDHHHDDQDHVQPELVCLATPHTLSVTTLKRLARAFDRVVGVEPLSLLSLVVDHAQRRQLDDREGGATPTHDDSQQQQQQQQQQQRRRLEALRRSEETALELLGRPDLAPNAGAPLTKLHAWRLTEYRRVLFLDADCLALRPLTHLFRTDAPHFAAAPDTGWPDCFNSGVMLLEPSEATFESLRAFALRGGVGEGGGGGEGGRGGGSWDGADQGLLNDYFGGERGGAEQGEGGGWHRLSFRYNVTSTGGYTYAPAFQRYGSSTYVAHFIGATKPWQQARPSSLSSSQASGAGQSSLLARWYHAHDAALASTNARLPLLRGQATDGTRGAAQVLPTSRVRVVHTETGVEVIEDAFEVPTLEAAWERGVVGATTGVGTPEELKALLGRGGEAGRGVYSSLPLDGRVSLIPPDVDAWLAAARTRRQDGGVRRGGAGGGEGGAREETYSAAPTDSPHRRGASFDGGDDHDDDEAAGAWTPPKLEWDPARAPPPASTGRRSHQVRDPLLAAHYDNAWDRRPRRGEARRGGGDDDQGGGFFVPRPSESDEASRRRTLERLRRERHFDDLVSRRPDPSAVSAVFPWEERKPSARSVAKTEGGRRLAPPTRVFPDEEPPSTSPGSGELDASLATVARVAGADDPSALPSSTTTLSTTALGGAEAATDATAAAAARRRGLPTNLAYRNAWDELEPIQRYARRVAATSAGGSTSRGVQAAPAWSAASSQTPSAPTAYRSHGVQYVGGASASSTASPSSSSSAAATATDRGGLRGGGGGGSGSGGAAGAARPAYGWTSTVAARTAPGAGSSGGVGTGGGGGRVGGGGSVLGLHHAYPNHANHHHQGGHHAPQHQRHHYAHHAYGHGGEDEARMRAPPPTNADETANQSADGDDESSDGDGEAGAAVRLAVAVGEDEESRGGGGTSGGKMGGGRESDAGRSAVAAPSSSSASSSSASRHQVAWQRRQDERRRFERDEEEYGQQQQQQWLRQQREGPGYQRKSLESARWHHRTQPRSPRKAAGGVSGMSAGSGGSGGSGGGSGGSGGGGRRPTAG